MRVSRPLQMVGSTLIISGVLVSEILEIRRLPLSPKPFSGPDSLCGSSSAVLRERLPFADNELWTAQNTPDYHRRLFSHPLFRRMTVREQRSFREYYFLQDYMRGEQVLFESDILDSLYIVLSGSVSYMMEGRPVKSYFTGDFWGAEALHSPPQGRGLLYRPGKMRSSSVCAPRDFGVSADPVPPSLTA